MERESIFVEAVDYVMEKMAFYPLTAAKGHSLPIRFLAIIIVVPWFFAVLIPAFPFMFLAMFFETVRDMWTGMRK